MDSIHYEMVVTLIASLWKRRFGCGSIASSWFVSFSKRKAQCQTVPVQATPSPQPWSQEAADERKHDSRQKTFQPIHTHPTGGRSPEAELPPRSNFSNNSGTRRRLVPSFTRRQSMELSILNILNLHRVPHCLPKQLSQCLTFYYNLDFFQTKFPIHQNYSHQCVEQLLQRHDRFVRADRYWSFSF